MLRLQDNGFDRLIEMQTNDGYRRRPVPFDEIVAELKRFAEQLESYSIQERGRLGAYRRHIEVMIALQSQEEKAALLSRMSDDDKRALGIGIIEAAEMAEFSAYFSDWSCEHLRDRLRLVVRGPLDPMRESGTSQQARSAAFELCIATHAKKAGLSPQFAVAPDLSVEFRGVRFLVQCKRPLSNKGVDFNLDKARRQLRHDFRGQAAEATLGVIALSLSRVLLAERAPDVGPFYFAESVSAAEKWLNTIIKANVEAHVGKQLEEPSCSGVIFHITAPFYIEAEGLYTWLTRIGGSGEREGILKPFTEALSDVPILG